jgi:hypothetical protein
MQATTDHGTQYSKWVELRAKTDRQLAALLRRILAGGVRLAREAAATGSPDLFLQASQAYEETRRLLPCLRDAETEHRIERELERLRDLLDETEMSPAHAGAACP